MSARPRYTDWAAVVAGARRTPERWARLASDAPVSVARTIRQRRVAALRHDDGVLEVQILNQYKGEDGQQRGDIYTRWVPSPDKSGTVHAHHVTEEGTA